MRFPVRAVIALFIFISALPAYPSAQVPSIDALEQNIEALRTELANNMDLTPSERSAVERQINPSEEIVAAAREQARKVLEFQEAAAESAETIEELKQRTQDLAERPSLSFADTPDNALTNELEQLSSQQDSRLAEYADILRQQAELGGRSASIADTLTRNAAQLDVLDASELNVSSRSNDLLAQAKRLANTTKRYQLVNSTQNLEAELATIPARQSLYEAQAAFLRQKIASEDAIIAQIQSQLATRRAVKAANILAVSKSALGTIDDDSPAKYIAEENVELSQTLNALVENDVADYDNIVTLQSQLTRVQQASKTIERILAAGRVSDELGELLRRLRAGLPKLDPLKQRLETIEKLSVQQQLNSIVWQDRLYGLATSTESLAVENTGVSEQLIREQKQILERLIETSSLQRGLMVDESFVLRDVIQETSELQSRLDRRLLWLSSSMSIAGNVWPNTYASLEWLVSKESWQTVLVDFWSGAKKSVLATVFFLFLPVGLGLTNSLIRASLRRLLARVGNVNKDTFWVTPLALVETFLLALPLPLLIGTLGGILAAGASESTFSKALAAALAAASSVCLILLFFRSMCRKNGIFVGHFGWSETARQRLRVLLFWFVWLQTISTFFFAFAIAAGRVELRYGLGMFAFIGASAGITLFNYYFFRPKNGVASTIIDDTPASPLVKFSFPLLVAIPLAVGVLPLIGFFDTAVQLQSRLFQTGIVLIFAAVVFGILQRIFHVAYRRFKLRNIKDQRIKGEQSRAEKREATASGDAIPADTSSETKDDGDVSRQARSIFLSLSALVFLVSLWLIWKPILPALGIIDDIVLWQRIRVIDGVEVIRAVTMWNVVLSVLFIIAGFIAARNIRGILEVGVFERLDLDPGARYAAITVLGYVLVGAGLVIGFAQLGIDWSKLQWIVAALGVGLGFGLQEIVANFISGIIILFERPIRVGDTVTIGTLSGTVSNIKIRATTVTDFDNREVLLPNKSIITENVTNWTLNDAVTRIVLRVGVAYGSDISKVRELLISILDSNQDVLKQPKATVFFMSHGDSSLDFELRVFVESPAKRLPVTNDINTAINQMFQEQGISIPFPQRDLHIITDKEDKTSAVTAD